ncbi:MAG: GH3 auxin-responsive promoter family protein [Ruminiclostridium sp.]|nr:GH3 auxin-responsive promoter family protein [Ruminiclostridium sp.]
MGSERYSAALRHFREVCGNAFDEQEKLLLRLMRDNKDTEYGRRYGFCNIHSQCEYGDAVPITEYKDYDEYISRIIKGERDLISSSPPVFYSISSGSTGTPKYIPLTEEDIFAQGRYAEDTFAGIVQEELPHDDPDELFGCIFNLGSVFLTSMADGTPNGIRSGSYHQCRYLDGTLDVSHFFAPAQVIFPEKMEDMLYIKLRFALANKDITAIHGVFVHRVWGIIRYVRQKRDALLSDIATGTVSELFGVSDRWRDYICEKLPADPERAEYLRTVFDTLPPEKILRAVWKKLRYIRMIGGSIFSEFDEKLKPYIGDIPVHSIVYSSSESTLGLSPKMNVSDCYVLLPDVCFYEFIPEDKMYHSSQTLTVSQVETGKRYELVITTLSGLYRYRIGDVVEIVGRYGLSPIVRVCYRKNLVLNVADERLNVMQFNNTMEMFAERTGSKTEYFCISGNHSDVVSRYVLYIETNDALPDNARTILDECFCVSSLGYKGAREIGDLGLADVRPVQVGSFAEYERRRRVNGRNTDQSKPLRILIDDDQINFFERKRII